MTNEKDFDHPPTAAHVFLHRDPGGQPPSILVIDIAAGGTTITISTPDGVAWFQPTTGELKEILDELGWRARWQDAATKPRPIYKSPPDEGEAVRCIVCGLDKPWGLHDGPTGAVVCRECFNRASGVANKEANLGGNGNRR